MDKIQKHSPNVQYDVCIGIKTESGGYPRLASFYYLGDAIAFLEKKMKDKRYEHKSLSYVLQMNPVTAPTGGE